MPPELSVGELEQTFGVYPSSVSSSPIDSLKDRLEKETLYVLSHLVLQNTNIDLIFMVSGYERMNACLAELQQMQSAKHEQLFVWEQEKAAKQKVGNQHFLYIFVALLLLYIGGNYSKY